MCEFFPVGIRFEAAFSISGSTVPNSCLYIKIPKKSVFAITSLFVIEFQDFLCKLLTFYKNCIKLIARVSVSVFALARKSVPLTEKRNKL